MKRRRFFQEAVRATLSGVLRTLGDDDTADATLRVTPFTTLRRRFTLQLLELNPVACTRLGGAALDPALAAADGRLRDCRPAALDDEAGFLRGAQRELAAMDAATLPPRERVDHRVMSARVALLLHRLESLHSHETDALVYAAEPAAGVDALLRRMDAARGLATDTVAALHDREHLLARLEAAPGYLRAARQNLLQGRAAGRRPDRRPLRRAMSTATADADRLRGPLARRARRHLDDADDAARQRLETACRRAADALDGFAAFLDRTYTPDDDDQDRFAAGTDEYDWRLRHVLALDDTADSLWSAAGEEVRALQGRMRELARRIAHDAGLALDFDSHDDDRAAVRAVLRHLAADAGPGADACQDAADRAVRRARALDILDIPADYRLDVDVGDDADDAEDDGAPGQDDDADGDTAVRYEPAPPLAAGATGRLRAPADPPAPAVLAAALAREGVPGRAWHHRVMTLHAGEIDPVRWLTADALEDPAATGRDAVALAGWAHYAQTLVAEKIMEKQITSDLGEALVSLAAQLRAAARARVDVGLHTGRLSYDEAVAWLAAESWLPPAPGAAADAGAALAAARRDVAACAARPTAALAPYAGRRALVSLREAWRGRPGGTYSAPAFHGRVLRMGPVAVGHYRDLLLGGGAG